MELYQEMENIVADFTISNENTINAEYSIEQDDFDCSFEIFASGTVWGAITGNITDQTDLINILNEKATISYVDTNIQSEATSRAESDTLLQNNINTLSGNLTNEINARALADNNLQTQIDNINTAGYITKDVNDLSYYMLTTDINTALNGKQNTISDLADIRNNAENGNTAYNTIQNYGDIVTYNADNFATANQGALADTSIQPNDNITLLNNNAGYITGIDNADVVNALGYTPYDSSNPAGYITSASLPTVNNSTITIQKNGATVESFNLNQADNETINITVPTDTNDLTNGAGFITSADLPTLADLTTPAQMNAINSGATSTNIGQIATNTTAISTETLNRQNADNNLQSQIDAIVSSSDVYDIVGTYAELQAYDISTVPVNDIIKVLVDSTHNNSATYYRCIETNNMKSWSYIGSEGAYYTKSEADGRFVTNTSLTTILSDYVLSSDLSTTLANYVTSANLTTILDDYATQQWVNNQGYLTGITSSDVTTALGFTPYNATNPNGYITSSALTPYALISSLSTVATSGLYSDLTGLPTIPTMTSQLTNNSGFITSADLPTNYLTTDTAQNISGRKTFLGEKAIYFKQIATSNKLGFTLYNPSNTELGALEYRPNTIGSASLLTLNCPQATGGYVGFRYWGTPAVNIVAPKVATAGNYYIPTHITNGTSTVTASNTGTVNISTLLPDISTKQDTLISGTNIKTINGNSLLGSGNITIEGGSGGSSTLSGLSDVALTSLSENQSLVYDATTNKWKNSSSNIPFYATYNRTTYSEIADAVNQGRTVILPYGNYRIPLNTVTGSSWGFNYWEGEKQKSIWVNDSDSWTIGITSYQYVSNLVTSLSSSNTNAQYPSAKCVYDNLVTKQDTLVSGINIKTINNQSLLGSGNIDIQGGGGGTPSNMMTTDTAQDISGQKTFTSTIKSSVDNSLALTRSTGDAFGVTVKRTDANNEIKFGIGFDGDNRGIWDVRHNKWAFSVTNDGKSYALGNEIAIKSDLNSLSPLRYSRYSIAQVNSTNKFIKLASMTFTQSGNKDFSYLFWVEILEASTAKCYALVRLSARWSNTSYQGHKFEILEKYGGSTDSLEALKNLTYAYSLNTTTHKITAEIWLEIRNASWVSYYLRPTECNEYSDYSNTPVTLSNNIWTYYNKSGDASSIASTAITSGLTQVKVTDATGVRNENNLSQVMKMWAGTKAQYDAITTKDSNTIYNVEGVGLYKGTTLISNDGADTSLSNLSTTGQAVIDGKADTDLSNLSATGKKVIDGQWVSALGRIITSSTSLNGSTALPYTITALPDDGNSYEVLLRCNAQTDTSSGSMFRVECRSDLMDYSVFICGGQTRSNSYQEIAGSCIIPVSSTRTIYIARDSSFKGKIQTLTMVAYRRIGTNS